MASSERLAKAYPFVLQAVATVLECFDINDVEVESIQFARAPKNKALTKVAIQISGRCPPGHVETFECKPTTGGGMKCELVCKPNS